MDCPVCKNVALVMADRQGIEIDYCPRCRGVWLDRGELDKLIERSNTGTRAEPRADQHYARQPDSDRYPGREPDSDRHPRGSDGYGRKKKKGLLGELFDFD